MHLPAKNDKISAGLIGAGALLIIGAIVLFFMNFAPVLSLEWNFFLRTQQHIPATSDNSLFTQLKAQPDDFYLIIPKIDARAKIIADVDPFDAAKYNAALSSGIAHAANTAKPGKNGNTFLFAHSGRNFYDNLHMNVQFYLLDKMEPKDLIFIKYLDRVYIYEVNNVVKVWPDDISYLTKQDQEYSKLTLMSCWPAGINYQRQIVEAELSKIILISEM